MGTEAAQVPAERSGAACPIGAVTAGDWGWTAGISRGNPLNVSVTDSKHKFVELTLKIRCPLAYGLGTSFIGLFRSVSLFSLSV